MQKYGTPEARGADVIYGILECLIADGLTHGLDDAAMTGEPLPANLVEADGRDCKRFADFFRKRRKK